MLLRVLDTIGVENIEVAENGVEGIDLLSKAESEIDLIICDIKMPEMDGYKFVRQIRLGAVEGYQEVPILILTADGSAANVRGAKFHKLDWFITKPATADNLRRHMLEGQCQSKIA